MSRRDLSDLPRDLGPYTLTRRVAVGGMAEVYVAKTRGIEGFEKLVAIKVIHPRYSEDDDFVRMLVDEAKLSVLLSHANIAQTFDLGYEDETYFIVMELVEGVDAFRLQKRAAETKKPIPLEHCAQIVAEVCSGLDFAHRKCDSTGAPLGIVHRDISPQNVLVSFGGEVKIVDFGIAKAAMRSGQTEVGVIKGKYYYMSPEQAWADSVDYRSDIFSAGIVLHELLTGEMLYSEENLPKLLDKVREARISRPSRSRPEIPQELDAIVMKALARQPGDRFACAMDFAYALQSFITRRDPTYSGQKLAQWMVGLFPREFEQTSTFTLQKEPTAERPISTMSRADFQVQAKRSVLFDTKAPPARDSEPDDDEWEDPTTVARGRRGQDLPNSTELEWDADVEIDLDALDDAPFEGAQSYLAQGLRRTGSFHPPPNPNQGDMQRFVQRPPALDETQELHAIEPPSRILPILAGLLILGAIVGGGYWYWRQHRSSTVTLVATPSDAVLSANGQEHTGRLLLRGKPGQSVRVLVQREHFESWNGSVMIPSEPIEQTIELQPARIDVTVRPAMPEVAQVYVDGLQRGFAPVTLSQMQHGRPIQIRLVWSDNTATEVTTVVEASEIVVARPTTGDAGTRPLEASP